MPEQLTSLIHNSALAAILRNLKYTHGLNLDQKQVNAINKYLDGNNAELIKEAFKTPDGLQDFIQQIQGFCDPTMKIDMAEFSDAITSDLVKIQKQCELNAHIYPSRADHRAVSVRYRTIYNAFLSLPKEGNFFERIEPQDLDEKLANSKTPEEFMSHFRNHNYAVFEPGACISSEDFYKAKRELVDIGDPLVTTPFIKKTRADFEKLCEVNKPFHKVKNKAEALRDINPKVLQQPVYTDANKETANQMLTQFKEQSAEWDLYIKDLKNSEAELQLMLKNLPAYPRSDELKGLRILISQELSMVRNNIGVYSSMKEKIERIDDNNPGLIQATEQSLKGLNYHHEEEGVHRAVVDADSLPDTIENSLSIATTKRLSTDNRLEPNQRRVISVSHVNSAGALFQGQIIESQGPATRTHEHSLLKKDVDKETIPTTYDIKTFPTGEGSEEAKVHFAMVVAKEVLANVNEAPSKNKPIQLTGGNAEQLKYVWTALMILGDSDSKIKFGADAIQVHSTKFNPEAERRFIGGFSKDSLYETVFKDNGYVGKSKEKHEELMKNKFGHEDEKNEAIKNMEKFKKGIANTAMENLPDDQQPAQDMRIELK